MTGHYGECLTHRPSILARGAFEVYPVIDGYHFGYCGIQIVRDARSLARLGSEPLHKESRTTTTSEEAILPQRPEVANRGRRSHQRAQTATWTESLSLSRRCWHATVGGPGRDCRQSDQYRSIPGSHEQRIGIERRSPKGERDLKMEIKWQPGRNPRAGFSTLLLPGPHFCAGK
jgi:hypothetical protein